MSKELLKRIGRISGNVLLSVFLAFCLFLVVFTLISKKDSEGTASFFGYQMRVVTSESMAACEATDVSDYEIGSLPLRTLIFVKQVPRDEREADAFYQSIKVGDVLTFRYVYTRQVTITHRVVAIAEKATGGYLIELAGDNKNSRADQLYQTIDTSIPDSSNYVIGKVTGHSLLLGILLSTLKTPIGIVFLVIVPCFLIILLEVMKIVGTYAAEKKKQTEAERAQKEEELAMLRERVALLEKTDKSAAPKDDDPLNDKD